MAYPWIAMTGAVLRCACGRLPDLKERTVSTVVEDTAETQLGEAALPLVQSHPGASGVLALADGRDAFAVRALLVDAAERTIDVQYYIWRNDMSGQLLFEALRRAADRGVRVRLLLDDNNTSGLDAPLARLNAHPNIEVRLFNPFVQRCWRALGYLIDFSRLNRRMHNKSFTVDNQVTVIGGRNVGDEYFGAAEGMLFADLDVMAIGPVVNDVSQDFDAYWASDSSFPAERILRDFDTHSLAASSAATSNVHREPSAAEYVHALRNSPFVRDFLAQRLSFEWANTQMISDDPAKALGQAAPETFLPGLLKETLGTPLRELELVSPYFVPTKSGVDMLVGLARRGVEISVLTNSLEATDVAPVHAGYAKRRIALLEGGVRLYELKSTWSTRGTMDRGVSGSSASSLHAKTFSVDGSRVFIGSFNFDPRSARLNTENGFVIDSAVMARAIADEFMRDVPARSYELRLSEGGKIQWIEREGDRKSIHDEEPGVGFWRGAAVSVLQWLPIESLL